MPTVLIPIPFAHALATMLGLSLILANLSFDRELAQPYSLGKLLWSSVVPGGLLLLGLLRLAIAQRVVPRPRELVWSLCFAGWAAATLLWAGSPASGIPALLLSLQACAWLGLGTWLLRTPTAVDRLLLGLSLGGTATGVLGLLQWAQCDHWLLATPFESLAGLPQVDRPAAAFGHVNMAAEAALCGFLASAGLIVTARRGWLLRGSGFLGVLITGAFLLVAGSRAAWLGMLAAGVIWTVRWLTHIAPGERARVAGRVVLSAAVLAVVFVALDPHVRVPGRGGTPDTQPSQRILKLLSLDSGTEHERLVLWKNSFAMGMEAPWIGIGAGNWSVLYPAYARAMATLDAQAYSLHRQPEAAHMEALQLWCETGLIGFLLMALIWFSVLREGWRGEQQRFALLAIVVALIAASVAAYVFQNPVPSAVAWLCAGALIASPAQPRRLDGVWRHPWVVLTIAIVVVAVLTLAIHARVSASRHLLEARLVRTAAGVSPESAHRTQRLQTLDALDRAVARQPGDHQLHAERALALWNLGLNDQALEAFDRVLALNPDFVNALLLKAVLLMERDELGGAWELLRRAILIQPESPELRFALGQVLESRARRGESVMDLYGAVAQYRQAVAGREFMPLARLSLARLLLDSEGSAAEAAGLLEKAAENSALMPELLAACARLATHPRLLGLAPGIYGCGGRRTLALWRAVLALDSAHATARCEVALAPLHSSRPSAEQLAEMQQTLRDHGAGLAPLFVHYHQARIHELADRNAEALTEWNQVLGADPWPVHPCSLNWKAEARAAVLRLTLR